MVNILKKILSAFFIIGLTISSTSVYASGHGDEGGEEVDENAQVPADPEIGYFTMEPDFTTNVATLNPREKLHYVRAKVSLMLDDSNDKALLTEMEPLIKDAIISILGSKEFAVIASNEGREKMRAECRDKLTAMFQDKVGRAVIQDVLFVSYMYQ
ncbi:MAG TPA: flagellar basal body-associated protein FliL [Succinivibrionaceae bacterium]|nr:flagellar basal body-associated FliL family protein [Succinivibrio sp.]HAR80257.1 flagellar basal body-associated protein FliL [Succinivibrionaceae bacterium]